LDRIFIAGATAQETARDILDDNQRMALSGLVVGRQHEVAIAFEAKCVAPSESPDLPKS